MVVSVHRVSQSSATCRLTFFLDAMLQHPDCYFLVLTAEVQEGFCVIAGFPNIIECVARMHVPILILPSLPMLYRSHHGYHILNLLATCGAQGLLIDIITNFPGGDGGLGTQNQI